MHFDIQNVIAAKTRAMINASAKEISLQAADSFGPRLPLDSEFVDTTENPTILLGLHNLFYLISVVSSAKIIRITEVVEHKPPGPRLQRVPHVGHH